MCNKIDFESSADAKEYYKLCYMRNGGKSKLKPSSMRTYECPYCGKWHLTTKKRLKHLK